MADNAIGVDADRCRAVGHRSDAAGRFGDIDGAPDAEPNEFIRGPKWRTRTTAARRHRAAAVTAAGVVVTGAAVLGAVTWLLAWLGAPTWLVVAMWAIPTAAVLLWSLARPRPAIATDDDDDGWTTYAILYVLIGADVPRAAPLRIISAAVLGGPIVWSLLVFGLSTLVGVFRPGPATTDRYLRTSCCRAGRSSESDGS